jgi:hypothetical protein
MPKPTIADCLKNGLAAYTGREVASIKTFPDPKVEGTWAARATMADGATIDFLVVENHMEKSIGRSTPDELAEAIEETQFDTWPPKVGKIRFF